MKDRRLIVGIETGNVPARMGAAVVEVSGKGDETVLELHGFRSYPLPSELLATLQALEAKEAFESEEMAGINFLVLHQLSTLFQEVLDEVEIPLEQVDLVGLKELEAGGGTFPDDPTGLSEATGTIVVSRFCIGIENEDKGFLPVRESILKRMVSDLIDRFGLESEVREAAAVALLANEALFHENCLPCEAGIGRKRSGLKAVKRTGVSADGSEPCLFGEFFFPQ
jgi:hypothetical protein